MLTPLRYSSAVSARPGSLMLSPARTQAGRCKLKRVRYQPTSPPLRRPVSGRATGVHLRSSKLGLYQPRVSPSRPEELGKSPSGPPRSFHEIPPSTALGRGPCFGTTPGAVGTPLRKWPHLTPRPRSIEADHRPRGVFAQLTAPTSML